MSFVPNKFEPALWSYNVKELDLTAGRAMIPFKHVFYNAKSYFNL